MNIRNNDYLRVLAYALCGLVAYGIVVLVMSGYQSGAKQKIEQAGWTVTSMHLQMFGCNGMKGRVAYRFTTYEHHDGKICYGGMPAAITYDSE